MFYWWFPSRKDPINDPLVIWLQGGPGCSGEFGLLAVNGPFKLTRLSNNTDDSILINNTYSWNNRANLLYVDQPIGTGFSNAEDAGLRTN